MTILLIGFTAGHVLLQIGYKSFNVGTAATQLQQKVRIALETMIRELQETSVDTIVIEGPAISFASARDADDNFSTTESGAPDWRKAVVYFLDAESNTLYRYEEAKENWSANFNPTIAFDAGEEALEQIASTVKAITFQLSPDNLLSITITLTEDAQGEGVPEEITTAVKPRN